ncbi:MAG: histidine triad nucleotide-binding protein [Patescibacteria group bacterium]
MCILCDIVSGRIPKEFVYQDEQIAAFYDINPQAPVHILIIPKKHIASLNELTEADENLMGKIVLAAKNLAEQRKISIDGYKIVANCGHDGGQVIDHIHFHLLGGKHLS